MTTQVWIWWISGILLGGIATFVVVWALLSDRLAGNHSKRRCPSCWYDMSSMAGTKCPECGREARAEAKLFRVRRRWGWAGFGVIALVGAFALNWYAAGSVLGWTRVMPLWLQVRLVPIVPVFDILTQNSFYNKSSLELDAGTAKRLQEISLAEIRRSGSNPNVPNLAAQPAAYALAAMKSQISDREAVGKVLLRAAIDNPGMMHHTAGKLAAELLGQEDYFVATAHMLRTAPPAPSGPGGQRITPYMLMQLAPPYSDQTVIAAADLAIAESQPGVTYTQLAQVIQENPSPFFARLLELFRTGDKNQRGSVLWVLRGNVRTPVAGEPSYMAICREACTMLNDDDPAVRDQATLLIGYFFPDVIVPVFPELSELLSASRESTRRYARTCFVNVKFTREADEQALVDVVCETLRSGHDRGRALALEILILRKQSLRPGVSDAFLDAIERVEDTDLADQLVKQYVGIGVARELVRGNFAVRSGAYWEDLQQRLVSMLDRGGAHTAVACKWIARAGLAQGGAADRLSAISSDASRPAADRASARDALFHIRDRREPQTDVLAPLK